VDEAISGCWKEIRAWIETLPVKLKDDTKQFFIEAEIEIGATFINNDDYEQYKHNFEQLDQTAKTRFIKLLLALGILSFTRVELSDDEPPFAGIRAVPKKATHGLDHADKNPGI